MKHLFWLALIFAQPALATNLDAFSKSPQWLRLLHYQNGKSAIDHPSFFLSSTGRSSPEAELIATLAALESPARTGNASAYCRFPARRWLLSQALGLSFPRQSCDDFIHYQHETPFNGASFLLAAGYLQSASSVFGHTFFRIKRGSGHSHLLDPVLNYTANTQGDNDLAEIIYGLGGGYRGRFSQIPFYDRLNHHNIGEDRDIWEYPINLSRRQLDQLQRHYWEIKNLDFPYYFMSQNCLTQLVALVNAVAPEFDILGHSSFKVTPLQTFSLLKRRTTLLGDPIYHPSPSNLLRYREGLLQKEEVEQVQALLEKPRTAQFDSARALDLALEQAQFQFKRSHPDLLRRRNFEAGSADWPITPIPQNQPAQAHGSWRSGISGEYLDDRWLPSAELRFIYHDFLDPEGANPWATEVEMFKIQLQRQKHDWHLREFTFLNLTDLHPRTRLYKPLSAITRIGYERFQGQAAKSYWRIARGWSWGQRPFTAYLLPSVQAEFGQQFQQAWSLRSGLYVGFLWQPAAMWKVNFEANASLPLVQNSANHWSWQLEQQWSMDRDWGLRWSVQRRQSEHKLSHALSIFHYW